MTAAETHTELEYGSIETVDGSAHPFTQEQAQHVADMLAAGVGAIVLASAAPHVTRYVTRIPVSRVKCVHERWVRPKPQAHA